MFIYFITPLIALLVLSSFSSILALKTNFVHKDYSINERIVFQEKITKEAVDSYCRAHFNQCETNSSIIINASVLEPYHSQNFTPISDINLTQTQVILTNTVDENYIKLKENQNAICLNETCTNIQKAYDISEELKIKFLQYNISILEAEIIDLQTQIATLELQEPIDQEAIDLLNAEILIKESQIIALQEEITILNDIILNRKVGGL